MSEWFQTAFGEDYINLYAHRDSSEATKVVDLILAITGVGAGDRVLDAPCGAGRHLKVFDARGVQGFGFDLSLALLAQAKKAGVAPSTLIRADLRALPYKTESFDMVVNLFSSLGYFSTDEENFDVLCGLVSLCRLGGWFVIDFMNSHYVEANLQAESRRTTPDGMIVRDRRWIDGSSPRVNKHTTVNFPDGSEKIFEESVRLFSPDELRKALVQCGVPVEAEYGGYGGEAFTAASDRIILLGRRNIPDV